MLNWEFLHGKGCFPNCHVVLSDGCSGQFKFARCWYFMPRYHNLTSCNELPHGCQLNWNYFATGHGKGEVDGVGVLLKREIKKE